LALIYDWLKTEFTHYRARGTTIGTATVDQLLLSRELGGCHDFALVFAAVSREFGYPAVMIDTYSISWIEQFQKGEAEGHIGHVFVEVYLDDKWILVDPTNGWYVEYDYDPSNPIIPLKGSIAGSSKEIYGFYAELKGLDSWSYGIYNNADLTQKMDEFASEYDLSDINYPKYQFFHFNQ
jgi:transglutaminase-like putative cysteine protease